MPGVIFIEETESRLALAVEELLGQGEPPGTAVALHLGLIAFPGPAHHQLRGGGGLGDAGPDRLFQDRLRREEAQAHVAPLFGVAQEEPADRVGTARPGQRRHDLADHAVRRFAVDVVFEEEVGGEPPGGARPASS